MLSQRRHSVSEERGHFDDAFEVSDDDVTTAMKPPTPWERGPADGTVKEFRLSAEPGPSGYKYFAAFVEVARNGKSKIIRDNSLSLSPAAKGKFIQFCHCFGLLSTSEINQVRRQELSPVGLTGPVVVGIEKGEDGNDYNRVQRYVTKKSA
jgi:hypothetical protein